MKCPICNKDLAFGEKMQLWDKEYGEDVILDTEYPVFINIFCDNCDKPVA